MSVREKMAINVIKLGKDALGGDDVELEVFHTLFTGQTNLSGKTTTIRTLVPRLIEQGYTVLIFDTKPTVREFLGYHEIPICYRETTDALVLIGLLESIRKARLSMYYATLSRLTEKAKGIPDIIRNAVSMEKTARSGFVKDACHTLADLLSRLSEELGDLEISSTLELKNRAINVLPINTLSTEAQQLVIKTAFEELIKHHNRDVVVVIDEAFRFLPQEYSSACKRAVQDVVTQGARTGLYVWLATQFIAPTDKDAIKGMANKLLGRQDDPTEIEATQKRLRDVKLKADDLMNLKRGEFIFVPLLGRVLKVYIDEPIIDKSLETPVATRRKTKTLTIPVSKEKPKAEIIQASPISDREMPSKPSLSEKGGDANDLKTAGDIGDNTIINAKIQHITINYQQKPFEIDTDGQKGRILFGLVKRNGETSTPEEIASTCSEYGLWVDIVHLSDNAKPLEREGRLIIEGRGKYRLGKFTLFEVPEIPRVR